MRILSYLMLICSIVIFGQLIHTIELPSFKYNLYRLIPSFELLIGPLLYFYILSVCDSRFKIKKSYSRHLILFALILIYVIYLNNFGSRDQKRLFRQILHLVIIIQNLFYFILTLKALKRYGLSLRSFLKFFENDRFTWVKFFILGFITIWTIQLVTFIFWDIIKSNVWCIYTIYLYIFAAFIFFNAIILIALNNPSLFSKINKYQYSPLSDSDKIKYIDKLKLHMIENKPYLDSSLSLQKLSQELACPMRYLSHLINESLNTNFYDYINRYRIEESKKYLQQRSHELTILQIAYEVGFNSKTTFNTAFKKFENLTPSEFKKSCNRSATIQR